VLELEVLIRKLLACTKAKRASRGRGWHRGVRARSEDEQAWVTDSRQGGRAGGRWQAGRQVVLLPSWLHKSQHWPHNGTKTEQIKLPRWHRRELTIDGLAAGAIAAARHKKVSEQAFKQAGGEPGEQHVLGAAGWEAQ